ncbi:unnamed protein product, partial [Brenthis ino]
MTASAVVRIAIFCRFLFRDGQAVRRLTLRTWSTPTSADSYWTPSRCAKILIDKDVRDLPADSFIFVKGAGCRWWGAAWWCAATPPLARAAAPPAATTTSPCSCRPRCAPPNPHTPHSPPHPPSPPTPTPTPMPTPTPAPLVNHIVRASDTLGKDRGDMRIEAEAAAASPRRALRGMNACCLIIIPSPYPFVDQSCD